MKPTEVDRLAVHGSKVVDAGRDAGCRAGLHRCAARCRANGRRRSTASFWTWPASHGRTSELDAVSDQGAKVDTKIGQRRKFLLPQSARRGLHGHG